jgi:hypothetical protein
MYTASNTATYREEVVVSSEKKSINGVTVYNKKDPEKVG